VLSGSHLIVPDVLRLLAIAGAPDVPVVVGEGFAGLSREFPRSSPGNAPGSAVDQT
jgi:hypothetical protein